MNSAEKIKQFLSASCFAVVGASADRSKYGNKVLRCYLQNHKPVYPVNPHEQRIEGLACVQKLSGLPSEVQSISVITPPSITEKIVKQAIALNIKNIWLQPGAENDLAIKQCQEAGINLIAHGPCLLVVLGFKE
jgi:predicted CoA-binding protein